MALDSVPCTCGAGYLHTEGDHLPRQVSTPMPTRARRWPRPRAVRGDGNTCDRCPSYAPWSVQDIVGDERINRWYACGRHLTRVLREGNWEVDAVEVRYLSAEAAESLDA